MEVVNDIAGLPDLLLRAVQADEYDPGASDITASGLITAPRIRQLRKLHAADIKVPASRVIPSLLGKAFHALVEKYAADGEITEERLYAHAGGLLVGGAVDLQAMEDGSVEIVDWKVTKVGALEYSLSKWQDQLTIYGWLAEENNRRVSGLKVVALLKDWSERRLDDPEYPRAPVAVVPLKLYPHAVAGDLVESLVRVHLAAERALPLCSDADRWIHPDKFKVGRRIVKTRKEAEELGGKITVLQGRPICCENDYCNVAPFCTQWQAERSKTL